MLSTVVDDFYDGGGSKDEQLHLIQLVEKWNGVSATDFTSEKVEIIFTALRNTVNELGEKAFKWQRRDITSHIVQIWVTLIKSMMIEGEWLEKKTIPTINEYNTNAYVSFALGPIVLRALYLVGHYLSEDAVRSSEYHNLFRLMSTCGRNLNDIQGFKKDKKTGKLNGVSLLMIHDPAVSTKEEAMRKLTACIDSSRSGLMELILKKNGSVVPRACKDLFWDMCRVVHLFYVSNDGYTSAQQMVGYVNYVLFIPLQLPEEM
ncbi:Ent-kaurene synthase [Thalictrum thalictroides]|uniref:Ent-kaurene synthase n=1 Tax=Thalictrum thalictroides TaxID=46969 RepID=A0A7J6V5P7_THATH|nr:Ent-kaurene synthase [Thalictrum thalictroides]